ncbi:FxDxF family PEP-CTERM protein [Sphingomonas sp.]|uniref:FxDxF family PEP-CTERM protein n=1 Tax=Sphingomonas sp. TaxID=28214 RepID=UPI0028AA71C6|nr:FxDxF family PEP-CTERM protein [Sphingomonas sp.]
MITKLLPALGAIAAVASFSAPAQAATVVTTNYTGANMNIVPGADGTYSANFGKSGIVKGNFQHIYTFTLPAYLTGSASITTSAVKLKAANDLDLFSVVFNGIALTGTYGGLNEAVFVNDVPIVAGKPNTIVINGMSRGNGSYGAQATFAPVPEPASWAMMIGGFAFVGGALRRRQSVRVAFA